MLTARKKSFIDNYMLTRNASDSARKAGYSIKTCRQLGSRLLTDKDVKSAIDAWEASEHAKIEEKKAERTKDSYVETVWKQYETVTEEPSKIRALELAGKAMGFIGTNDSRPNQTLNITLNKTEVLNMIAPEKWNSLRSLLESD